MSGQSNPGRVVLAGVAWLALSQPLRVAHAQAQSVPLGGRTATMGGAGVAEGHDIAAPLINPAGVAAVGSEVFGLSSSLYSYNSASVKNFFAPSGFSPSFGQVNVDTQTFQSSNLAAVPSGAAFFTHVGPQDVDSPGHLVLGIAALTPVAYNEQADARLHATLASTNGFIDRQTGLAQRALDLYVGPVAGLVISKHLRAGLSLLGLYRNRYLLATTTMTQSQEGGNDFASYRGSWLDQGSSFGGIAVAGVQLEVLDDLWLGASVQSPSVQIEGSEHQTRAETLFLNAPQVTAPTNLVDQSTADLRYSSIEPPRLSLGAAYDEPDHFALAADVAYVVPYPGIDDASGTSSTSETLSGSATRNIIATYDRKIDGLSRVDFAIGAEAYVAPNVALRAGFSEEFDPRALPAPSVDTVFMTRRNLTTVTGGVGLVVGPFDTTLGVAWQHASGTIDVEDLFGTTPALTANYPGYARLDLTENTFMFLLSGTVTAKEAIIDMFHQAGAAGGAMGTALGGAELAARCPKALDHSELANFDYASAFPGHEAEARALQGSLVALAGFEEFAARLESQVTDDCARVAQDLGKGGPFAGPAEACDAARQGIEAQRDLIAHGSVEITAPVCSVSLDGLSACVAKCLAPVQDMVTDVCSRATAPDGTAPGCGWKELDATSCAATCQTSALGAITCTPPGVHFTESGAHPELAALERDLPGLMRAGSALADDAPALVAQARNLVKGVQAVAHLVGSGGAQVVPAVAACVIAPALTAVPAVKNLVEDLETAASVAATVRSAR